MEKTFKNWLVVGLAFCIGSCEGQNPKVFQELKPLTAIEQLQAQSISKKDTPVFKRQPRAFAIDFKYAARKVIPGVVHVKATWGAEQKDVRRVPDPFRDFFDDDDWFHFFEPFRQRGPTQGSASGVILTADGYIITNNHVVENADEIEVVLHDQRSYKAKVIGSDPKTDLSLLKIEEKNLTFIEFGNSDMMEPGDWVLAVGNPFNLASTITAGIVSAKARNINILKDREAIESFIQTDAAVNPGNSGGALVDLEGKLVGINSAIATPTGTYAGYSFAIPVNLVKKVADDLLNYGAVQRGYMGITIRTMSSELARDMDLKFTPGVFVDSLVRGGAAMEAGIKPHDVITKIDGNKILSSPELQEAVARHRPGEKLRVTVLRNGEEKIFNVTLKSTDGSTRIVRNEKGEVLDVLGIEVEELSASEAKKFDVKGGLKVTRIGEGKISEHTAMKKGFVITKVDGVQVLTKADLEKALAGKKGGVMIEGIYPGMRGSYYYGFGVTP
jgi:serine protease Do